MANGSAVSKINIVNRISLHCHPATNVTIVTINLHMKLFLKNILLQGKISNSFPPNQMAGCCFFRLSDPSIQNPQIVFFSTLCPTYTSKVVPVFCVVFNLFLFFFYVHTVRLFFLSSSCIIFVLVL